MKCNKYSYRKPPELVAHIVLDPVVLVPAGGLDGELPAAAPLPVAAVVLAVAAGQELGVRGDEDVLLRQPPRRVVDVLHVGPVHPVAAGHGHVLGAVADVLDLDELLLHLELVPDVEPPLEGEEVHLHPQLRDPEVPVDLLG